MGVLGGSESERMGAGEASATPNMKHNSVWKGHWPTFICLLGAHPTAPDQATRTQFVSTNQMAHYAYQWYSHTISSRGGTHLFLVQVLLPEPLVWGAGPRDHGQRPAGLCGPHGPQHQAPDQDECNWLGGMGGYHGKLLLGLIIPFPLSAQVLLGPFM